MDKKRDEIAHRRIVAGREIPRKYGQNNNSPATRRALCGAKDAFWLARHTSGRPTPHNSYRQHRSLLPLRRTPTSENCDSSFLQQAGSYRRINKQFFSMLYRTATTALRVYTPIEVMQKKRCGFHG